MTMTMKQFLIVAATLGAAAASAGCGPTASQPPPASTITFELRNDGAEGAYLFRNCLLNYTVTMLGDPIHAVGRVDGCLCRCGQTNCGYCGACAEQAEPVAAGAALNESWLAVDVTFQETPTGGCFQQQTLPAGSYRIDVPVYSTADDATAGTPARIATQTFSLPAPGDHVAVALGVSP